MVRKVEVGLYLDDVFSKALGKPTKAFASFSNGLGKGLDSISSKLFSVKGLLAGLGAGLVVRRITSLVTDTADFADQIGKLSTRLGVSTELLSEWAYVGERSNVAFSNVATGIQRLTRRFDDFQRLGTGQAATAFDILGITELAKGAKNVEELLPILADAFEGLEDDGKAVAAAFQLFDTEGVAFLQFLKDGSRGINDLRREARELGKSISAKDAQNAAEFNDAITKIKGAFSGFVNREVLPRLPKLTEALEGAFEFIVANKDDIAKGFETIGSVITRTFSKIIEISERTFQSLRPIFTLPLRVQLAEVEGKVGLASIEEAVQAAAVQSAFRRGDIQTADIHQAKREAAAAEISRLIDEQNRLREIINFDPAKAREEALRIEAEEEKRKFDEFLRGREERRKDFEKRLQANPFDVPTTRHPGGGTDNLSESDARLADRLGAFAAAVEENEPTIATLPEPIEAAADAAERLPVAISDANDAAQESLKTFSGYQFALDQIEETASNAAVAARLTFATIEGSAATATDEILNWADGTKSASEAIKDAGRDIVKTLARIALQAAITRAALAAVSGLSGLFASEPAPASAPIGPLRSDGTFSGAVQGPLTETGGFAFGGIGYHGTGEQITAHGIEAHIPTRRGAVPIRFEGGGGGGGNTYVFNVQAIDTQDFGRALGRSLGSDPRPVAKAVAREIGRDQKLRSLVRGT